MTRRVSLQDVLNPETSNRIKLWAAYGEWDDIAVHPDTRTRWVTCPSGGTWPREAGQGSLVAGECRCKGANGEPCRGRCDARHSHDVDEGRELRPKADQIEADDTGLMYKAAASGRTDVLGPAGLLGLQRAVGNAGVTSAMEEERSPVLNVVGSGGGAPLDTDTRADMESRLGHDFGDVRVHTDSNARRTRRGRSTRTPTPSARTSCSSATSTTPPRPRADRRRRALRRAHRARHSPRGLRRRTPSRAHPLTHPPCTKPSPSGSTRPWPKRA